MNRGRHSIQTGLDRLLLALSTDPGVIGDRSFGLLAHGPSVTSDLVPIHLALSAAGARPAALFGPEHGYYGVEQDMIASADESDPWTGVPIVSLYGDSEASLRPRPDAFDGLDLLLIDLQDVGSRYYTYVATAVWAAEVALAAGVEVWILDRPNPLGGLVVEGASRQPGFESFVGAFETPVRHGLTLGELVALQAKRGGWEDGREAGWTVWEMEGWSRDLLWRDLDRPWIAPSPNMPTFDTAVIYPGGCLIEATTLSEGRGTTRPFQLVGSPEIDPMQFAERVMDLRTPGVTVVPTYFKPQFQKHAGASCGGIEIVVTDAQTFPAYRFGIDLVEALWQEVGGEPFWRPDPYEFVTDIPAIDLLVGTDRFRKSLESGTAYQPWCDEWAAGETAFREECRPILLYGDGPGR